MRCLLTGALLLWLDGIRCQAGAERGSSTAGPLRRRRRSAPCETTSSTPSRPRRPPSALSPRPGSAPAATTTASCSNGAVGDRRMLVASGRGVGLSVGPVADRDRPLGSWSWWAGSTFSAQSSTEAVMHLRHAPSRLLGIGLTVGRVGAGLEGGEDPGMAGVPRPPCPTARTTTGSRRPAMDGSGDTGKATAPQRAPAPQAQGATPAPSPASDHPSGQMGPRSLPPNTGACSQHGRCSGMRPSAGRRCS
jgi:hypothetical protein